MNDRRKYSINSRKEYLNNRKQEVLRLRNSVTPTNMDQIQEYISTIIKSYDETTVVDKITVYKKEEVIKSLGFRSIGLYQSIKKEELLKN